jgi:hypothetical protein
MCILKVNVTECAYINLNTRKHLIKHTEEGIIEMSLLGCGVVYCDVLCASHHFSNFFMFCFMNLCCISGSVNLIS